MLLHLEFCFLTEALSADFPLSRMKLQLLSPTSSPFPCLLLLTETPYRGPLRSSCQDNLKYTAKSSHILCYILFSSELTITLFFCYYCFRWPGLAKELSLQDLALGKARIWLGHLGRGPGLCTEAWQGRWGDGYYGQGWKFIRT